MTLVLPGHKEKIREGLEFCYQMEGMPQPANFDFLVKNWTELLKDIPTENVVKSFKCAYKDNNRTKLPKPFQVIEASKAIKNTTPAINDPIITASA